MFPFCLTLSLLIFFKLNADSLATGQLIFSFFYSLAFGIPFHYNNFGNECYFSAPANFSIKHYLWWAANLASCSHIRPKNDCTQSLLLSLIANVSWLVSGKGRRNAACVSGELGPSATLPTLLSCETWSQLYFGTILSSQCVHSWLL